MLKIVSGTLPGPSSLPDQKPAPRCGELPQSHQAEHSGEGSQPDDRFGRQHGQPIFHRGLISHEGQGSQLRAQTAASDQDRPRHAHACKIGLRTVCTKSRRLGSKRCTDAQEPSTAALLIKDGSVQVTRSGSFERTALRSRASGTGPRNRSRAGLHGPFQTIRVCTCRTRRSTGVCSCRVGACSSASWRPFTVATNVQVHFCDPQSPWQRGTNENTNGLLRQYFLKGTDLAPYTQADLDEVALRLNTRPRKTLGYETPADRLAAAVASTG